MLCNLIRSSCLEPVRQRHDADAGGAAAPRHRRPRSHGLNPTRAGLALSAEICCAPLASPERFATIRSRWACGRRAKPWPATSPAAASTVPAGSHRADGQHQRSVRAGSSSSCAIPATACSCRGPAIRCSSTSPCSKRSRREPYRLEYHGTWRIDLDDVAARIDDADTRRARRVAEQPDGLVPASRRSARARRALRGTRPDADRRRSVRRLSARRSAACRVGARRARCRRVQPRRLVEVRRAAAGQARLDWLWRPDGKLERAHDGVRVDRRHVSVGLDAGAGGACPTCSRAARTCARRFSERIAANLRIAAASGGGTTRRSRS